jgi:hypothetical protein
MKDGHISEACAKNAAQGYTACNHPKVASLLIKSALQKD